MSGDKLIQMPERMAQLSVAYIKAIASHCGYGADVPTVDHDSVDITISSSASRKAKLDIQLKSTTTIDDLTKDFSFPLSVKNYDDLRGDTLSPRILVVLCLPQKHEDWIKHTPEELALRKCAYWLSLRNSASTNNTASVNVTVPVANGLSPFALTALMQKADHGEDI